MSDMSFGMKKIGTIAIVAVLALLLLGLAFWAMPVQNEADAASPWSVQVGYTEAGNFVPLSYDAECMTKELFFRVYGAQSGNQYCFYVSKTAKTVEELDGLIWVEINANNVTPVQGDNGISYYEYKYEANEMLTGDVGSLFIYFCMSPPAIGQGGASQKEYYGYGSGNLIYWHININAATGANIGFYSISAKYRMRGASEYSSYRGAWTANPIVFTVVTEIMNGDDNKVLSDDGLSYIYTYDRSKELLSYSENFEGYFQNYYAQFSLLYPSDEAYNRALIESAKKANWSQFVDGSNEVSISKSLNGIVMWFRVTDITGGNPQFAFFSNDSDGLGESLSDTPIRLQLDPVAPHFDVISQTYSPNSELDTYRSGTWTSNTVRFTLSDSSSCISDVTYMYSLSGGGYIELGSNTLELSQSASSVIFRAVTVAGQTYDYPNNFVVNIDSVVPQVRTIGYTIDPDGSSSNEDCDLELSYEDRNDLGGVVPTVRAYGYANNKVMIKVYNRTIAGEPIVNTSGVVFECQDRSDKDSYTNNWQTMTSYELANNERCYLYTFNVGKQISATRFVRFRIRSGAGVYSGEAEVRVIVLNSVYTFALPEDNYLIAQYNQDGWIADKAIVRAIVSVDAKDNPTTKYTFYYWAGELEEDGSSLESRIKKQHKSEGVPVEYYDDKNGDIMWIYEFELKDASARSYFNFRAMNAAGKLSGETRQSYDIIAIDVAKPTYAWDAYLYPVTGGNVSINSLKNVNTITDHSYEEEEAYDSENEKYLRHIAWWNDDQNTDNPEPGWVNGPVLFVLCVQEGVSGIKLKEMVYAKDAAGNAMYDTSGNLVWQEVSGFRKEDMVVSNSYYYFFELRNETTSTIFVQEYRYRIYTGSGISADVTFTISFDATETIQLRTVNVTSATGKNDRAWNLNSGGSAVISADDFSVSENYALSFSSSLDRTGIEDHYNVYYYPFTVEDMGSISGATPSKTELLNYAERLDTSHFIAVSERSINAAVLENKQGTYYYAVYIRSKTRNWQGYSNRSGMYVICIDYDTLKATINFSINLSNSLSDENDMSNGTWKTGSLTVTVGLKVNESDVDLRVESGYTFYYKLIKNGSANINAILDDESTWVLAYGHYDGNRQYVFDIPFTNSSFYGEIALSVCNKAKYRSYGYEQQSRKTIRIDNTTPDIMNIITNRTEGGRVETRVEAGKEYVTIHTKDKIYLNAASVNVDDNHSTISFYYKVLPTSPADRYNTSSDMTLIGSTAVDLFGLSSNFKEEEYSSVYVMLFAINTVGTFSGSDYINSSLLEGYDVNLSTIYEFLYDPSVLTATALTAGNGADFGNNNMYEFLWQEKVSVSMTIKSSKRNDAQNYYRFMFSVDNRKTWFDYMEAGSVNYYTADVLKELTFTADSLAEYVNESGHPFENGVMSTFFFRAINKAGAYVDCGNIYIAIDETVPEFNVLMYDHNGLPYASGVTTSMDGDKNWTNGPVSIKIDVTRMPASGIRVYYSMTFLTNGRQDSLYASDNGEKGKELIGYEQFSTDRLSGFNINRDAIIRFVAISRSGAENVESRVYSVRVSVDQQIPYFTLTGRTYNQSNATGGTGVERIISSGDWTMLDTVSVSKEVSVTNVSGVVYTYVWDAEDSAPEQNVWSSAVSSITRSNVCGTLTVTATSADGDASKGKTHTEVFEINIDTTAPKLKWSGVTPSEGLEHYIDLKVTVEGDNLDIVEYITVKEDTRGFTFNPTEGKVLSTSSVDNSLRHAADEPDPDVYYRGYVHIYVRDKAGHEIDYILYVVPFPLTVNNIELTDEHETMVRKLTEDLELAKAAGYMDPSRVEYFENLISRLNDRLETLRTEIDGYRDYLENIAQKESFELRSDYAEMLRYRTTFQNYEVYGQKWIQTAITGDSTSVYYGYYKVFLDAFDRLHALMEKVQNVETNVKELPAINMVESEDYTDILRVYDEYMDLTSDQRDCFTPNLYNKLMDLKEACEVLLLSDKDTGVVLDGDFAPGATVEVTTYGENTDTYQNAQTLLMNSVESTQPRAIVSIYRVALTGAYAQTAASDINIQLPIPEEYRSYIQFSVYELGIDGSMKKIPNTKIQPDGMSVAFSANSLGTYVLCVRADIQETEINKDSYGTILGIPLTATMIKYVLYIGGALLLVIFLVCIILGIRQRRFMNSYNRAYSHSIYRRQSKGIPKGNKLR